MKRILAPLFTLVFVLTITCTAFASGSGEISPDPNAVVIIKPSNDLPPVLVIPED